MLVGVCVCGACTSFLPVLISSSVIGSRHCCGMLKRSRSLGRTPNHFMSGVVRLLLSYDMFIDPGRGSIPQHDPSTMHLSTMAHDSTIVHHLSTIVDHLSTIVDHLSMTSARPQHNRTPPQHNRTPPQNDVTPPQPYGTFHVH